MLSLKKLIFLSGTVFIASFNSVSLAAVEPVECSTNTVFNDNECGVCYLESIAVTGTGTALEITGVKVPWKNTQTGISEVAFEIENDIPEIISDHKIITDPDVLDDLWKFTNPWTGIGEYALASGKETTLTELIPEGSIKVYGKGGVLSPTVLIKSELNYVDREVAKLKESESKTRNICLLYNLTFSANNLNSGDTAVTPATTPAPTPTTTTPPTTNNTTTVTTPPATPATTTTPVTPIPKPATAAPAANTTTPTTTTATNNTNTTNTTVSTTNNTTNQITLPVTNTTNVSNATTPVTTTSNTSSQTKTNTVAYTPTNIPLNSAGVDPTATAVSKIPTGPTENTILFFVALFISGIIYWKKQKNSVK